MILNPKYSPYIKKAGRNNQLKNTIIPIKNIKISIKRPTIIKINLTIAPITRENKLEKKVSRYPLISKL